jgi:hypothetical protein
MLRNLIRAATLVGCLAVLGWACYAAATFEQPTLSLEDF